MSKNLLIGIGILVVIAIWLFYSQKPQTDLVVDPTTSQEATGEAMMEESLVVNLAEQNDSGQTGTATLTEEEGQVTVTLSLLDFPEDIPQPAHIHLGACPDVGAVAYPLTNVVNGESVTVLDVTLAQLESEAPLGINVHQSVPEASIYTACGDLAY